MASSSMSQDDVEDFERNSRRSRIRTARARQIANCRIESNSSSAATAPFGTSCNEEFADTVAMASAGAQEFRHHHMMHHHVQHHGGYHIAEDHYYVTEPLTSTAMPLPTTNNSSLPSNANKDASSAKRCAGKPQFASKGKASVLRDRDRRKLREKRRSSGVVHVASTESTGGDSTTGDDDESSDAILGVTPVPASAVPMGEVKPTQPPALTAALAAPGRRQTAPTMPTIVSSGHGAVGSSDLSDDIDEPYPRAAHPRAGPSGTSASSALPSCSGSAGAASGCGGAGGPPASATHHAAARPLGRARAKSPSDLEADDENDHDSLNQSESSCSNLSLCMERHCKNDKNSMSRCSAGLSGECSPGQVERVLDENKRLWSLMEEKDRKIHLLEYKVQQLMKDTRKISEEQSRLQKENNILLKALSNITTAKQQHQAPASVQHPDQST